MISVQKIKNAVAQNGVLPSVKMFLMHKLHPYYSSPMMDIYYDQPLDKNKILVLGLGKSVRGNLQYILNELNHNPAYRHFQIYVRVSEDTIGTVRAFIKNNGWKQTHTVEDTKEYEYHMETAGYLLTETYFPNQWVKRDGQVSVNTWHGVPLKRLGLEKMTLNKYVDGITQKNFINADYLLYPNAFTRDTILKSYRVSGLMHGQAVLCGYPRTSGLCDQAGTEEIRKQLAPNGETFYAYMPTWKEYLPVEEVLAFSRDLLAYMDSRLREDQILYVNLHHKVSDQLDYGSYRRIRKFPADMDSYRLLAASDGLITDYSSVFFDYLASRKNIILFVPDLDTYEEKRGTFMDVRTLPFHMASTPQEVLDAMDKGKTYDDAEAYRTYCSWEHESNAAVLCRIFSDDLSGVPLEPLPKDDRTRILFYSDDPAEGAGENLYLSLVSGCDRGRYDLYLSAYEPYVMEDRAKVEPALIRINKENVIGLKHSLRFSGQGRRAKEAYKAGQISLREALRVLKRDYRTNFRLFYGVSPFSAVVIWAVMNAEQLLMLANAPCKVLVVLTEHLLSGAESGDKMLADAMGWLAEEGIPFASGSDDLTARAEKMVPALAGTILPIRSFSDITSILYGT